MQHMDSIPGSSIYIACYLCEPWMEHWTGCYNICLGAQQYNAEYRRPRPPTSPLPPPPDGVCATIHCQAKIYKGY